VRDGTEGQRDIEEENRLAGTEEEEEEEGETGAEEEERAGERNRRSTVGTLAGRRKLAVRVIRIVGAPKTLCRSPVVRRECRDRGVGGSSADDQDRRGESREAAAGPPIAWNRAGWDTWRADGGPLGSGDCCGLLKTNQPTNGTTEANISSTQ